MCVCAVVRSSSGLSRLGALGPSPTCFLSGFSIKVSLTSPPVVAGHTLSRIPKGTDKPEWFLSSPVPVTLRSVTSASPMLLLLSRGQRPSLNPCASIWAPTLFGSGLQRASSHCCGTYSRGEKQDKKKNESHQDRMCLCFQQVLTHPPSPGMPGSHTYGTPEDK